MSKTGREVDLADPARPEKGARIVFFSMTARIFVDLGVGLLLGLGVGAIEVGLGRHVLCRAQVARALARLAQTQFGALATARRS